MDPSYMRGTQKQNHAGCQKLAKGAMGSLWLHDSGIDCRASV